MDIKGNKIYKKKIGSNYICPSKILNNYHSYVSSSMVMLDNNYRGNVETTCISFSTPRH